MEADGHGLTPEPEKRFTCKLRARGAYQFELKLHYPLEPAARQIFVTDVYVFAPQTLDLSADSYGVRRVLQEVVLYVRHSSPRIPLPDLLRRDVAVSPLSRLAAIADGGADAEPDATVIYELKALVNAYRAESRATVTSIRRSSGGERAAAPADVRKAVELVVALPAAAREVRQRLERRELPPAVTQALAWMDEGLSVVAAGALFRVLDGVRGHRALRAEEALVRRHLAAETAYRQSRLMPLSPSGGQERADLQRNETILLRIRALKRWSQSALYLNKRMLRENVRVGQVAAGIAAALAMSFAVVAAAFAQEHFAMYSLPWAFIIIFSYILKDRIKEIVRAVIAALIPRLLSDRSNHLVDVTGRTVGLTREAVMFVNPGRLPAEVQELRRHAPPVTRDLPGDGETEETVIHFREWMRTRSSVLLDDQKRLERLTMLVRWGVDGWLEEMDEAFEPLRSVEEDTEVRALARRVYHVHIVVRVREEDGKGRHRLFAYRVALSREGIVRAERFPSAVDAPRQGSAGGRE